MFWCSNFVVCCLSCMDMHKSFSQWVCKNNWHVLCQKLHEHAQPSYKNGHAVWGAWISDCKWSIRIQTRFKTKWDPGNPWIGKVFPFAARIVIQQEWLLFLNCAALLATNSAISHTKRIKRRQFQKTSRLVTPQMWRSTCVTKAWRLTLSGRFSLRTAPFRHNSSIWP